VPLARRRRRSLTTDPDRPPEIPHQHLIEGKPLRIHRAVPDGLRNLNSPHLMPDKLELQNAHEVVSVRRITLVDSLPFDEIGAARAAMSALSIGHLARRLEAVQLLLTAAIRAFDTKRRQLVFRSSFTRRSSFTSGCAWAHDASSSLDSRACSSRARSSSANRSRSTFTSYDEG
jgi:hypothetical protein